MIAMVQEPIQLPQKVSSAADDSSKMNTDCVYFLASPLTCKKGSQCEYRHSEYARLNPRDCYYWLNGNCRNPVCAFRHPPLDGLLGSQTTTSSGSTFLTPQSAAAKNVAYNSGKQAVLCVFFQKGNCIKGDKCAFSHGLNNASNKLPHAKMASADRESSNFNNLDDVEKISHEQNLPAANFSNSAVVPLRVKLSSKSENGIMTEKSVLVVTRFSSEVTGLNETSISSGTSISPESSLSPETSISPESSLSPETRIYPETDVSDDHSLQNGHNDDDDELYRESSPGFNVLVHDEEPKVLDYYHDDEQFGRRGYGEKNHLNEIDVECEMFRESAEYNTVGDADHEGFRHDKRGNESYDYSMQRQNERRSAGSDALERWSFSKTESCQQINDSYLRDRLLKQRRHDGSRSSIYHPYANHYMKRSHHGYYSHRKDSRNYLHLLEDSLSCRFRGRLKIPERLSSDIRSERDFDRRRNFYRLSPGRTQTSLHHGRFLRDRLGRRVQEDFNHDDRNFRGHRMRNGIFTDSNRPNSLSFEGPKPLSEILKIKRGSETSISEKDVLDDQRDDEEIDEHVGEEDYNNIDEEEIAELDDEYTDDFAKKIGVLFP